MQDNKNFLGTEPVGKLLLKLSIPTVIAQLINMLYNIVDRIYIGHIPGEGSLALTGVGVCMPIIMIVSAFAALVSSGGAPRASIYMGKQDNKSAENILGNCFILQIIISVILTAILLIWGRDLLLAFGASENTISYATDYMHIYAFGTLFVQLTLGMNAFITAQGFTTFSMVSVLIGAVCNIGFRPCIYLCFSYGSTRCCTGNCYLTGDFHTLGSFIPLRQKDTASPQEKASPPGGKGRSSLYRAGTCCFYHAVKRKYCNCLLQFIPASVRR